MCVSLETEVADDDGGELNARSGSADEESCSRGEANSRRSQAIDTDDDGGDANARPGSADEDSSSSGGEANSGGSQAIHDQLISMSSGLRVQHVQVRTFIGIIAGNRLSIFSNIISSICALIVYRHLQLIVVLHTTFRIMTGSWLL